MKNILKKSGVLAAAALLTVALATPSFGADGEKKPAKPKKDQFAKVDANGDGKVSLEEFKIQAAKAKKDPKPTDEQIEKRFKKLDKDASGDLSKEEMAAGQGKKEGGKPEKGEKKPKSE